MRSTRKESPGDDARKMANQYRKLAQQALTNARRAIDLNARHWFLSLADTMTRLAETYETHIPASVIPSRSARVGAQVTESPTNGPKSANQ